MLAVVVVVQVRLDPMDQHKLADLAAQVYQMQ
jgi:hypothetical protein